MRRYASDDYVYPVTRCKWHGCSAPAAEPSTLCPQHRAIQNGVDARLARMRAASSVDSSI